MTGPASAALEDSGPRDSHPAPRRALFSRNALEALYRHHAARLVRRLARRIDGVEAGDLVHEAFARLAAAEASARGPVERPEAFVSTVATNVLRDRARAAAREAISREHLTGEMASVADPHSLLESREALRAIEGALAEMNPRRRKIFMMHRFEQMSYAQIGREVDMSEKGIKKQIAKALVELRRAAGPL